MQCNSVAERDQREVPGGEIAQAHGFFLRPSGEMVAASPEEGFTRKGRIPVSE